MSVLYTTQKHTDMYCPAAFMVAGGKGKADGDIYNRRSTS